MHDVCLLTSKHISQRQDICRLLYENYLADGKWKDLITVDEAWMYLSNYNRKRSIYYRKRLEKDLTCWLRENKKSFAKDFMIITGFSDNGKLKLRKVEKNIKINFNYFRSML